MTTKTNSDTQRVSNDNQRLSTQRVSTKGVIYVVYDATGTNKFYNECSYSIQTLKQHNPNLPVTVFSDIKINSDLIENNIIIPRAKVSLRCKTNYMYQSPYDKTLFLDTDTYINHNLDDMFEILDKYDMALAHDFSRKRNYVAAAIPEYNKLPYAFSEFNTGVFLYKKCDATKKFFELWDHYFNKYRHIMPYDQPSARISFWESGAKIHTLPLEYNRRSKQNRLKSQKQKDDGKVGPEHLKTRIYHNHGLVGRTADQFDNEFHYV